MIPPFVNKIAREIYNISPFRKYFFYRYHYMFSPQQLCYMVNSLNETGDVEGEILEIGCAEGRTTVFLNKHLQDIGSKKKYSCIDTFSGFTSEDIEHEATKRNKDKDILKVQFVANKKIWVDKTLAYNGIDDVKTYEADINKFDIGSMGIQKLSLCIIDVDLYKPCKSALEKVLPLMSKGGRIIVDDCMQNDTYDGAYEAYIEFIKKHGFSNNIILKKLGIIQL
jgi:SAM-dependent methyltransferase